jgi:hypothetical protein
MRPHPTLDGVRRTAFLLLLSLVAVTACSPPARERGDRARPTTTASGRGGTTPDLRVSTEGPGGGGATSKGVTDRSITVAFHWNKDGCGADVTERTTNFSSKPADSVAAYVDYINAHDGDGTTFDGVPIELHGRRIKPVYVSSGGPAPDCQAKNRAAAIEIADEVKAFAAVGSTLSFDDEQVAAGVAQRGTMHFGSAFLSEPGFYARHHPYVWSSFSTGSVMVRHLADYIRTQLVRGGPPGHTRYDGRRVYGLIHPNTPVARTIAAEFVAALRGAVRMKTTLTYASDFASAQAQASSGIARLKADGVNTIVMLTDPVAPIVFTGIAKTQRYSPDYLVSSLGYLDTPNAAVNYEPEQWRHAYGVSDFGTERQVSKSQSTTRPYYRAFVDARPGETPPDDAVAWYATMSSLVWAISAAGPQLTPETAAAALTAKVVASRPGAQPVDYLPGRHGSTDAYDVVAYDPDAVDPMDKPNVLGRRRGKYVLLG